MREICKSGSVRVRGNGYMVEILWHRRETRRQTEKTNLNLWYLEKPVYSTHFILRLFWFLRIEGKENLPKQGPYLICPNHASYLDGLFIFSSLPFKSAMNTYFWGYQHIFEHPMLGWANKICRLISVDVSSHLTEAMQAVSFVLFHQKTVCIFPEGMRSIDANVKEF